MHSVGDDNIMGILDVISFLSIIPYKRGRIEGAASSMYLFPAAGLLVGVIAGVVGWTVSLYTEPLLAGIVVATTLCIMTGLHHIDGLADMADGLMKNGSHKERIAAMRDMSTGTAGIVAVVLCLAFVVIAVSQRTGQDILYLVILSEVGAKYAMVVAAYAGRAAAPGTGSLFCEAVNDRRLLFCTILWAVPLILMPDIIVFVAVSFMTGIILVLVSRYRFGGVTGDVLGATNEIGRATCMVVAVSIT